jgi:hypothetical protein
VIRLQGLHVIDRAGRDLAAIGFCFACSWDLEHGLGVLVHGEKIVRVADNSITWSEFSSGW